MMLMFPNKHPANARQTHPCQRTPQTLKRTIKVIKEFHKSTSSVLSESEASYQTPLPRAYTLDTTKSMLPADTEDVLYTQKSVPAVPQERPDPAFSTAKTGSARVADVRGQLVCVGDIGGVSFWWFLLPRLTGVYIYIQSLLTISPHNLSMQSLHTISFTQSQDDRMRNEVYVPVDKWLDDLTNAKVSGNVTVLCGVAELCGITMLQRCALPQ